MERILKPLNNKLINKKIFGFDIETYGKENKFLMGSIVGKDFIKVFWDREEFINFFFHNHKIRSSYIFATNLGFDFFGLFGHKRKLLSEFDLIVKGSDLMVAKYTDKNKHNVTLLDTMNFLKFGVANLGKIVNKNKLVKPKALGKFCLKDSIEGKELEKYNIRDSEISYLFAEFLQKAFRELGSNMKYTLASTSMSLFRNKYLNCEIFQPPHDILREMYKGYYGGRVEAFYRGIIKNKYLYDVNSLYPYVMQKYRYPFPNSLMSLENPPLKVIQNYEGLSYCRIYSPPDLDIPLLPVRSNNKLIFPNGYFKAWYTNVELRKAISLGYEVEPIKCYYYERTFTPFKDFVKDLYRKRLYYQKKKSNMELVTKLCMNSLYGKFSQRLDLMKIYFSFTEEDKKIINKFHYENVNRLEKGLPIRFKIDSPDYFEFIGDDGNLYFDSNIYYITDLDSEQYGKFINPILSIYTTAYARLEMYEYFEEIKNRNGKLYYTDTDSLITDIKFKESSELGGLKLELNIKKGIIIKPKFYYAEGFDGELKLKAKGLSNIKNVEAFYKILESGKYKYTKFTKFKESMRRKLSFNSVLDVTKIIDFNDNKRYWEGTFNKEKIEKSNPLFICETD